MTAALSLPNPTQLDLPVDLVAQAELFAEASISANTRRAYSTAWRSYLTWCKAKAIDPKQVEVVALYLADEAQVKALSTLEVALAAITQAFGLMGIERPASDPRVRRVLKGIRRTLGPRPQAKKAPLSVAHLRRICEVMGKSTKAVRDKCVILIGFAAALRRSELVALDIKDVAFEDEGIVLTLRRSKVDQQGQGRLVGVPYGSNPITCPVRATRARLAIGDAEAGPLLRSVTRHGHVGHGRLGGRVVSEVVKQAVEMIGLDPDSFGGHSLRAGLATEAARAGVGEVAIMAQTGHRSMTTLQGYIRHGRLFTNNAAAGVGL